MRVLFSSTRGSGHLQPLLPYARAMLARGHEVLVAAPADVGEALRTAELPHAVFDHPGDALGPLWARLRGVTEDEANAIAAREIFAGLNAQVALPKLRETVRDWRPDLVVRESAEYAALVAAAAAGVPHARVAVHSVSFEEAIRPLVAGPVDALRAHAGLPADEGASLRADPIFSSFPASLDRVTGTMGAPAPFRARVVEPPPSAAPAAWAPSDDPAPLVYVTFGTIAGSTAHVRSVYQTALDAVAGLPVRALLTTGPGFEPTALGSIPANVHVEAWVPQRDVMPRVAALVCHGGSGTLLGGLAAGVPMVVVPLFADQPHNGRLVAAAGAGLVLTKPTAAELRAALERVLADADLRRGARLFADEIAAMPTIDDAVEVMVRMAAR